MKKITLLVLMMTFTTALIISSCQARGTELSDEHIEALDAARMLSQYIPLPALDEVRRGCPACHMLANEETGAYTLAYEAFVRAEARGHQHPQVFAITDEVNVTRCLDCHSPGTGERDGKGIVAPFSLRDIVHPAHNNSQYWKLKYGGNCFTCHNVNGIGEFQLLSEKVDVDEKGLPNPDKLPIPGAIPIN
ncbi:MAG: hypothetical protein JSV74_05940 [Dehalococcoidia bacterium]|nr:MAG: hypothetical protein JSV74_05940 [Dehalococcoidia bacterium]